MEGMNKDGEKTVPLAVVKRLPRYYRYLSELLAHNITKISSAELSERMGITASQLRQDLNNFGGFGQQGYGYHVEHLYHEIGKILGATEGFTFIILGAGNLGSAIANYQNLKKRGFTFAGIFDSDPNKIGKMVAGKEVLSIEKLEEFVKAHKPEIAVLTLPKSEVHQTVETLEKIGIKGIWNFSYSDLNLSSDLAIENVHLSDSLMTLSYKINQNRGDQN